ncbi:hypothetical protein LshimejAT787_1602940 [Lyophyllum shimeji]|uniref:F-box domain-containing protein n=1 Tax=Lyophyllum shimeji TaxID=47721 RepID=A0A9P3UQV0_LYOSH|nr:hypothetical protein LshimejAT787_1602940 [Lyophyllum shimeji]
MHRCLKVAEIQSTIFECYDADQESSTLASLARTSTAFTESALNLLWRDLHSLAPLIMVMPDDLWNVEIDEERVYGGRIDTPLMKLSLTRALEESDWSRYDYYAQRVHSFGGTKKFPRSGQTHLDPSVLNMLSASRPARPLLPNLRSLRLSFKPRTPDMRTTLLLTPALLSSTLTQFSLFSRTAVPPELPEFLSSIARLCPNLRTVSIRLLENNLASPELASAVEKLILSLRHLESLDVHKIPIHMSADMIRHLGGLPALRRCVIDNQVGFDLPSLQLRHLLTTTTTGSWFPELRELSFGAPTLESAGEMIASLECPLQRLVVTISDDARAPQPLSAVASLTRSFHRHACASSLTVLSIQCYGLQQTHEDLEAPAAFASLLSLPALQVLDIQLPHASQPTDTWLAEAAASWPHLESLRITSGSHGSPRATLAGLIPLVVHCPRLRGLSLSLAATPFSPQAVPPGAGNTAITALDLQRSTVVGTPPPAPVRVLRCLLLLFPRLQALAVEGWRSREERRAWSRVVGLLEESVQSPPRGEMD